MKCKLAWAAPASFSATNMFGIKPDIMTLAKALGGGLPLGAMLAREDVAASFGAGSHASTFGGNPVACSAGLAVMQTLIAAGF